PEAWCPSTAPPVPPSTSPGAATGFRTTPPARRTEARWPRSGRSGPPPADATAAAAPDRQPRRRPSTTDLVPFIEGTKPGVGPSPGSEYPAAGVLDDGVGRHPARPHGQRDA